MTACQRNNRQLQHWQGNVMQQLQERQQQLQLANRRMSDDDEPIIEIDDITLIEMDFSVKLDHYSEQRSITDGNRSQSDSRRGSSPNCDPNYCECASSHSRNVLNCSSRSTDASVGSPISKEFDFNRDLNFHERKLDSNLSNNENEKELKKITQYHKNQNTFHQNDHQKVNELKNKRRVSFGQLILQNWTNSQKACQRAPLKSILSPSSKSPPTSRSGQKIQKVHESQLMDSLTRASNSNSSYSSRDQHESHCKSKQNSEDSDSDTRSIRSETQESSENIISSEKENEAEFEIQSGFATIGENQISKAKVGVEATNKIAERFANDGLKKMNSIDIKDGLKVSQLLQRFLISEDVNAMRLSAPFPARHEGSNQTHKKKPHRDSPGDSAFVIGRVSKFAEPLVEEFLVFITDQAIRAFLIETGTFRAIASKTRCEIQLTRRIVNRRLSDSRWLKYMVIRIKGPNQMAVDKCDRLMRSSHPAYRMRKRYKQRAQVSFYVNESTPDNSKLYFSYQRTGPNSCNWGELRLASVAAAGSVILHRKMP